MPELEGLQSLQRMALRGPWGFRRELCPYILTDEASFMTSDHLQCILWYISQLWPAANVLMAGCPMSAPDYRWNTWVAGGRRSHQKEECMVLRQRHFWLKQKASIL